ncbi:hypothetical protein C8R43DRAFT_1013529 [Mycena crocata]|nr:hypothetical protein C8R43DRAFT_1013529 [Mycena crocata]
MSEFEFDAAKLTIPMFIGTILNWGLLGALVVQIYLYFLAFPKDGMRSKVLVLLIALGEILQTLSDTRDTIHVFGVGWGNPYILDEVGWSWLSVPVIGASIACAGQLFFAWRIYIISRSLYMPVLISFITAFQWGAGIWTGVEIGRAKKFSLLQFHLFKPPVAWLAATALSDLVIAASTSFYLLKSRRSGFRHSTDAVISRIVKITVETGLLCAVFAILDLILFVTFNGNNYHLAVCIELSKVYSNSIMIILNSRAHIGHTTLENQSRMSAMVFESQAKPVTSTVTQVGSLVGSSISRSDPEKHYEVGLTV